jgi:hypothetical protein
MRSDLVLARGEARAKLKLTTIYTKRDIQSTVAD